MDSKETAQSGESNSPKIPPDDTKPERGRRGDPSISLISRYIDDPRFSYPQAPKLVPLSERQLSEEIRSCSPFQLTAPENSGFLSSTVRYFDENVETEEKGDSSPFSESFSKVIHSPYDHLLFPGEQTEDFDADIDQPSLEPRTTKARNMDRQDRDVGIVRWSPGHARSEFLILNLNHRTLQAYEATGNARPGRFDFQKTTKFTDFPPLTTYDWSPTIPGLVAIGTSQGEVNLLRIDDNSNALITLPLKSPRPCQSVSFNITGLLAVGLDRVRNDHCLQVWDVNQRLAGWDPKLPGFKLNNINVEPKKSEASVSVTSVRFFEDSPMTLVYGIKNQCVRMVDLRDPSSFVLSFSTRNNNNLAIDYADPNYFASSSLDQPGVIIWDKRAITKSTVSTTYLEVQEEEELPWGAVLKIARVIDTEKSAYIRQLRYNRNKRGHLGVLSSSGQLQVFHTVKSYTESTETITSSPEFLEVNKSHDLEYPYYDKDRKKKFEDRVISYDWVSLPSDKLPARVIALRANGAFEILQMEAESHDYMSMFVPWEGPKNPSDSAASLIPISGLNSRTKALGPLFATAAAADVPIFGPDFGKKAHVTLAFEDAVKRSLSSKFTELVDLSKPQGEIPSDHSIAGPAESLSKELSQMNIKGKGKKTDLSESKTDGAQTKKPQITYSSREQHEKLLIDEFTSLDPDAIMIKRTLDGYLFDCVKNQAVLSTDPWLQSVWAWIQGAEAASKEDGMITGPLDLSYVGVYGIWMCDLGPNPSTRIIGNVPAPAPNQWERLTASLTNETFGRSKFEGVKTSRPHARQLCLAIAGVICTPEQLEEDLKLLIEEGRHTNAAALALFEGATELAVEILKDGGSVLLFVAIALSMKLSMVASPNIDIPDWAKALEDHPEMAEDPYLRAIYAYITTGCWISIVKETALPLDDRVRVALRHLSDSELTDWLKYELQEATETGDIEAIVLAGITEKMVDILAKYVEKFLDRQLPALVMAFCHPRYFFDQRCHVWREEYRAFLMQHKEFIQRVWFDQKTTRLSRDRDGIPAIKPPPRQVTIRCQNCDARTANDLDNSGVPASSLSAPGPSTEVRGNPLIQTGINAGLCCPRCGARLPRCGVCLQTVGVPRSDRPELSNDPALARMRNQPTFCLKCKHVSHMDCAVSWFERHAECMVAECRCNCNARPSREFDMK